MPGLRLDERGVSCDAGCEQHEQRAEQAPNRHGVGNRWFVATVVWVIKENIVVVINVRRGKKVKDCWYVATMSKRPAARGLYLDVEAALKSLLLSSEPHENA